MDLADEQDASPWIADAIRSERQADSTLEKLMKLDAKVEVVTELDKEILLMPPLRQGAFSFASRGNQCPACSGRGIASDIA
jgi:excinuclease UvrABC ATPase subunit